MFMMYETLVLAFIALITPLFGKLAGYELRRKPFELVAVSACSCSPWPLGFCRFRELS